MNMITISTPVFATENKKKLMDAIQKMFPEAEFKETKTKIEAQGELELLSQIKLKIEEKRIKNTVRYLLAEHGCLKLNKQALVAGKLNFVEEEYTLGNVEIKTENPGEMMEYLVPSTI